jgi:hypothetical protein
VLAGPGDRSHDVPQVAQHNDLGCWNIAVQAGDFTVLDWESARPRGWPLWDLLYFAADAFARADRVTEAGALADHAVTLFTGRSRWSPIVFRWIREHVAGLGIPDDAVGDLAATCWSHHGESAGTRREALADVGGTAGPAVTAHLGLLAHRWLEEPSLGVGWSAWR